MPKAFPQIRVHAEPCLLSRQPGSSAWGRGARRVAAEPEHAWLWWPLLGWLGVGHGWASGRSVEPSRMGRAQAQDAEKGVHVHQRLPQLTVEPAQELQRAPQLQQQPLRHHLHPPMGASALAGISTTLAQHSLSAAPLHDKWQQQQQLEQAGSCAYGCSSQKADLSPFRELRPRKALECSRQQPMPSMNLTRSPAVKLPGPVPAAAATSTAVRPTARMTPCRPDLTPVLCCAALH